MDFKLSDVFAALEIPWPVSLGAAGVSGAFLYLLDNNSHYVQGVPDWAYPAATIVFLTGTVVTIVHLLRILISANNRRRWRRQREHQIFRELETLTPQEIEIMQQLYRSGRRSFNARLIEERIATLCSKGLIEKMSGAYSVLDWPHVIPHDVWEAMGRDPRFL